ncbi:DUF1569 domain-containing protein [Rhodopirellula sp. MGV]|uniref:DUF1569 domain-containing protein n=1 Tax=Rhodopirellula sp. MGV TaxID=2023130 RepID=UPI000B97C5A1|nr:DUF1569 domain-containing protein [Rhodopirellula sp. MGV]OYP33078.1 hypothetical protein CGZ80_18480 [Rhodopirellula sp. MGV]PNY37969.1 DUF1569 domain-containing protein [Rhodopirellula baltica]
MSELRPLKFNDLSDAVEEARQLLACGYVRHGNWSLGQICRHLVLVQDPSVDGYPIWMSLFAPLRPLVRRLLLPKVLSDDSPRGIRTAPMFVPSDNLDDAAEVDAFAASVERLLAHPGAYAPHPGFGRLPREKILEIHAAHAAHHLRHLQT